ncbi:MAG: methyltransferase [Bradymonadia bacterium]
MSRRSIASSPRRIIPNRGDRAYELMVSAIEDELALEGDLAPTVEGPWLVIDDLGGSVVQALEAHGQQAVWWRRRDLSPEGDAPPCAPWPEGGPFAGVALRLSRARPELAMCIELAAAHLMPGGVIWLYGANDEGAKSAGKVLAPWFGSVGTITTKSHCRLWWGRASDPGAARGTLDNWCSTDTVDLPLGPAQVASYPGCFAGGTLDPGTAMLLDALRGLQADGLAPARVLDFCCGPGVSAIGVRQIFGLQAALSLVDHDALATHAASTNVTGAHMAVGDGWSGVSALPQSTGFDLIVSNPPIHRGKALDLGVVDDLVTWGARALAPGGSLVMVIQRQRKVEPSLEALFHEVTVLEEDTRFRVWLARRPR